MTFRYTRFSNTVVRPIIRIGIQHGHRALDYDVLVDSGADMNVFEADLGQALGIDLSSGIPIEIVGATGEPTSAFIHPVTLTVGNYAFTAPVAFMPAATPYGLAGQRGFFDHFKVTFDWLAEVIELAPHRASRSAREPGKAA